MAKYLFQGSYTVEGLRGLLREGGTQHRAAVAQCIHALGGTLDTFYFAYGSDDFFLILDMPERVGATAVTLALNAVGAVQGQTVILITPEEIDAAGQRALAVVSWDRAETEDDAPQPSGR
jgi:uncharacterized protein with GYD domain